MVSLIPRRHIITHLLLLSLLAQPFSALNALAAEDADKSDKNLAPGFLLDLTSPQDAKLNGSFRIGLNGKIELPYDVTVDTDGMSVAKFKSHIETAYKPYFKEAPRIQVTVKQKRYWIEVRGLVSKPGPYLVKKDNTLDEVISLAGGLDEDLTTGYARIETRAGKVIAVDLADYFKTGHQKELPTWHGAERIFFQRERPESAGGSAVVDDSPNRVQILGEVRTPGEQVHRKGADGYYYLIKSGGPSTAANLDEVEVVRVNPKKGERETVHYGSISGVKNLQEQDIVIIHAQKQSSFEKFLQSSSLIFGILSAGVLGYVAIHTLTH